MNKENKIYIAYGSNLNLEQMKYRCPYATVLGNGTINGYELLFRGNNGDAVATVEPKHNSSVPILLWEITPRDEEALDRYEGWPHLYRKETIVVDYEGQQLDAMIYIMNDGRPLGLPSEFYLNTILQGYESAGFNRLLLEKAVQFSGKHKGKIK